MNKDIKQLPKEINKLIDSFIPYRIITSIPIDDILFYYLYITGVYILYSDKKILYIGFSSNVGSRLKTHSSASLFKDDITDIEIIRFQENENPIEVEARLIQYFKPQYNKVNQHLYNFPLPTDFDINKIIGQIEKALETK